jgi:ElaB/YqjD/DUF883 family membrane-anchored ribosome-binding protein
MKAKGEIPVGIETQMTREEFAERVERAIEAINAEYDVVLKRSAEIANEIAEAARVKAKAKLRGWEADDRGQ